MPKRLRRYYGAGHLHFITCSCYQRRPLLGSVRARNLFVQILGEVRDRFRFALVGYVVMPDHIHLLMSEPERGTPSTVMQVLKQRVSRQMRARGARARAGNSGSGGRPPPAASGRNLYPKAPEMKDAETQGLSDGELYYIISNGVRFTGMPAWGGEDSPEELWQLVLFIRRLPQLTPQELKEMEQLAAGARQTPGDTHGPGAKPHKD